MFKLRTSFKNSEEKQALLHSFQLLYEYKKKKITQYYIELPLRTEYGHHNLVEIKLHYILLKLREKY